MEVQVVEKEQIRVVGLSHSGAYTKIGECFNELSKYQDAIGAAAKGLVALYYDDPHSVPEDKLRSVAGVIVPHDAEIRNPDLKETQISGGKYATATFVGEYQNLGKAWEEFFGSIYASGLKTKADLCYERYMNTPADVPPDQLKTELYAPLA